MPVCTLPYQGKCEVSIVIDIHGVEEELSVLVDTGFVSGTGFGLKLPAEFARYANVLGTAYVEVADGRRIPVYTIPDAKILQIEDHRFEDGITIPAIFMSGACAIGVSFLQLCILTFDGPNRIATFDHVP